MNDDKNWAIVYMAVTPTGTIRRFRTFRTAPAVYAFRDQRIAAGEEVLHVEHRVDGGEWRIVERGPTPAAPEHAGSGTAVVRLNRRRPPTAADGPNRHGLRRLA